MAQTQAFRDPAAQSFGGALLASFLFVVAVIKDTVRLRERLARRYRCAE